MNFIKAGALRLGLYRQEASRRGDDDPMEIWKAPIVLDASCPDTLAQSYIETKLPYSRAGAVADLAEERKIEKYTNSGCRVLLYPCSYIDFWSHGEEVIHVCETSGPQSQAVYR